MTFKGERKTPSLSVVFQEPRLFPWLTVEENIALAVRHEPHSVQKEKTGRMLEMIGLTQSARAKPRELSGGMAQRVGVARALPLSTGMQLRTRHSFDGRGLQCLRRPHPHARSQ